MSEQKSVPGTGPGRIMTKVVLTYRLESDPKGTERTMVIEHGSGGEVVDAIVWSEELMRKIAYLENEKCVEPKKGPGTGDWKVYSPGDQTQTADTGDSEAYSLTQTHTLTDGDVVAADTQTSEAGGSDCVWMHQLNCEWGMYCPSEPL